MLLFNSLTVLLATAACMHVAFSFNVCPRLTVSPHRLKLQSTNINKLDGSSSHCKIKVIGVGGGGGNAVNRMLESSIGVSGVDLWIMNTDAQVGTE